MQKILSFTSRVTGKIRHIGGNEHLMAIKENLRKAVLNVLVM